jgi:hypothetical protein
MNSLTAFLTAVVIAVSITTTSLSNRGNEPTSIGPAVEGTVETDADEGQLIGPPEEGDGGAVRDMGCNSCSRR